MGRNFSLQGSSDLPLESHDLIVDDLKNEKKKKRTGQGQDVETDPNISTQLSYLKNRRSLTVIVRCFAEFRMKERVQLKSSQASSSTIGVAHLFHCFDA